jgi:hypothetical protein|tara:strand:- start:3530 stop:4090 length:561 start_codon:yes stop_codon:yes gene_type:complete
MSVRAKGRKISNFPVGVDLTSAYITYILSGVNYKILFSDFLDQIESPSAAHSMSYNTGATAVAIATASTPVKIAGTWVDQISNLFTVDGTGKVSYSGTVNAPIPITATITVDPDSGTKDITAMLYVNGAVVTATKIAVTGIAAGDKKPITLNWFYQFSTSDYVEIYLQNDTDTTDLTTTYSSLRIN